MKIAVIGAGSIGNLVAGYLKNKGKDVCLVGNPDSVRAIKEKGLFITGTRGNFEIKIDISEKLNSFCDLVILAVKTQDIQKAIKENLKYLKSAIILTTQNGVQADKLAAKYLPEENIISSIVMFGSTYLEPGKVIHNFEGSWIIGYPRDVGANTVRPLQEVSTVLNKIFPVVVTDDITGMKYLKIFVNANNCLPAILGISMQQVFSDLETSRISIAIWKEGLDVINNAGIKLVSLPDFPLERLTKLTSLPQIDAAKIFSGIMVNLSKEPLYGSILQSIKRGKSSEIDYINGEFINLAKENNFKAALNEKLVEMVHRVEKSGEFFNREDLLTATKQFLS